ncbi:hypothetical protein BT67DRAFT_36547 [Trichocladium antarcticum]|uniref:Uncharacterized protein n=1 Tax=Trichocladium antarcticum TaxID=1450529 RepID=A0AAN6UJC8_9PEZI|nr:hypothetical protein BT67DRAFT_36547 [Trichocladium antarcticum]
MLILFIVGIAMAESCSRRVGPVGGRRGGISSRRVVVANAFRGIQAAHIYVTSANAGAAVLRDGVLRPPSAVICVAALPMPVLPIPRELGLTIRPSRLVIRKVRHRTLAQAPRHPDHGIPMNLRYLCCQAALLRSSATGACILQRCRTWSEGCDGSRTHPGCLCSRCGACGHVLGGDQRR